MSKSTMELYHEIEEGCTSLPLSQLFPMVLRLAKLIGNTSLARWVQLEVDGYIRENPVMGEDIEVPAYRSVSGERTDEFDRPLLLQDPRLQFINEERLRQGVAELEHLSRSDDLLYFRPLNSNELIRKELHVEVTRFRFHPSALTGVLSGIRSRLLEWLTEIEPDISNIGEQNAVTVSPSKPRSPWRVSSLTLSALCLLGSLFWFCNEPGFEPLIGIAASIFGLVPHNKYPSPKIDIAISVVLIAVFIWGLVTITATHGF
jgi:hypothetical protein